MMRSPRLAAPPLAALAAAGAIAMAIMAGLAALPATAHAQAPTPANIPRLEQQRDRAPTAVPTLRTLGIAYYKAARWADARRTLEQAHELAPRDGVVALYLGMAAEQQHDLAAARVAYTSYLTVGRTSRARRQLRQRLAALSQQEIRAFAKQALLSEQTVGTQAGDAKTVAVMPLRFSGADSSLLPLERGVAELLVADLSRSAQLTVVERERMQALLDEIQLARAQDATDATTSLRAGRLMRAGRIVSGQITQLPERRLAMNTAVVDVPTSQSVGGGQGDDGLDALFALEKRVAMQLFTALGVTLTPQELARVEERPTRSLAAFLAYSNGLVAEDGGDWDSAVRLYSSAVQLDPNFTLAIERQQHAENARAGQGVTPRSLEATLAGTVEGGIAFGYDPLSGTLAGLIDDLFPSIAVQLEGGMTPPTNRDPASSGAGTDHPTGGNGGRIVIIIQRPGTPPTGGGIR